MELVFSNFQIFLDAVQSITEEKLVEAKKILETSGKDIENISDIIVNDNGELFDLLPDGTLVRVNLYIATKEIDRRYTLNSIQSGDLYKYHLYQCSTISTMFNSGRKHRYKLNTREDGTFFYTFNNSKGKILKIIKDQKLNICKNCLKKFLGKNFVSDYDVANFDLRKFHQQNSSFFDFDTSSMEKEEDAKPNVYSRKWTQISNQIKTKYDYTCQECGWRPKTVYQKKFIHTHHQNGDKHNNRQDNLKVLCIKCHSEVDTYHTRIKSLENYREFLNL
ncbi:MAG: Unknown protein [uncultured Sulfurovum sp.]|uniref:HNH nuclease domain-containing protein n=1 Tax=uncultured Sulfurovum sp. TaxID=269237 RepID=A0A6S6T6C4_9BACT|nr:MAG: Unknown protein [uncultured Sulfurovum sp.]